MIKKIVISIGGQDIELTPEQLNELKRDIDNLKAAQPITPFPFPFGMPFIRSNDHKRHSNNPYVVSSNKITMSLESQI